MNEIFEIDHEQGLAQLLALCWSRGFQHTFSMPKRRGSATHWHKWRDTNGSVGDWTCFSLSDASKQYAWDYIAKEQRKITAHECRVQLNNAMNASELATKEACKKIFTWGGVGRSKKDPSRTWIRLQKMANLLKK